MPPSSLFFSKWHPICGVAVGSFFQKLNIALTFSPERALSAAMMPKINIADVNAQQATGKKFYPIQRFLHVVVVVRKVQEGRKLVLV